MPATATASRNDALAEPPATGRSASRLFEPGDVTLEAAILGVWEDLTASGRAECPVCGGRLGAADGCDGCGAELS